jgi:hypothetical protein
MLSFTSWSMSDISLDESGVFSMLGRPEAKKPEGKCCQIQKGAVRDIVLKALSDKLFQIDCSIGIHSWQFQSDSKSAMEALKTALEALA